MSNIIHTLLAITYLRFIMMANCMEFLFTVCTACYLCTYIYTKPRIQLSRTKLQPIIPQTNIFQQHAPTHLNSISLTPRGPQNVCNL